MDRIAAARCYGVLSCSSKMKPQSLIQWMKEGITRVTSGALDTRLHMRTDNDLDKEGVLEFEFIVSDDEESEAQSTDAAVFCLFSSLAEEVQ